MNRITGGSLFLALVFLAGCASAPPPAVGVWGVNMDTPLGPIPVTLTLNADGSGMMSADPLGDAPVADVMYDGANVSFSTEIDAQGQTVMLDFSGAVEGDTLDGAFATDFGDLQVTGTRQ
ncbi:MAG: hypothetical protein OXE80_06740 [Gammaproteobacteria bacterium]|nr:hypothetical protein [Gammaproteobacteria bacterium]MCY4269849.1 hypothetical protein [Gammaproteobacteria bacterium]